MCNDWTLLHVTSQGLLRNEVCHDKFESWVRSSIRLLAGGKIWRSFARWSCSQLAWALVLDGIGSLVSRLFTPLSQRFSVPTIVAQSWFSPREHLDINSHLQALWTRLQALPASTQPRAASSGWTLTATDHYQDCDSYFSPLLSISRFI